MKKSIVLVGLLFLVSGVGAVGKAELHAYASCGKELKNSQGNIHLIVENCTNVGTFSLGGIYQGNWEKLTFLYPLPWEGTFLSWRVDGKVYLNSFIPGGEHLDDYLWEGPEIEGNEIKVKWLLPEGIFLEEIFSLKENGTLIKFKIRNQGEQERIVGLRLHLDTMIGDNDGAPIYLPGKGLITEEKSYQNINFDYWKAYNRQENPTIISHGILADGVTLPDEVIIANWRKSTHSSWDYSLEGVSILGDSAVLLYFGEETLLPGREREITTYYGKGAEILPEREEFGIGEVTSDKIEGYCQGDKVKVSVDVVNQGSLKENYAVEVVVKNSQGEEIFSEVKKVELIPENSVKSVKFEFSAPENNYPLDAEAVLSKDGDEIARKVKKDLIKLRIDCKIFAEEAGLNLLPLGFLIILLIALFFIIFYYIKSQGEIIFEKIKIEDKVKVRVFNQSKQELKGVVIEDKLPSEDTEVDISTFPVVRSRDKLRWEVGNLKPGEKATLEYKISTESHVMPPAKLIYNSQEKESENITESPKKTKAF